MHIYVFGSVCRGEVDASSDIDMLALVSSHDTRFNPKDYSVYSYERINELWELGNPFSWHLFLESKLVYSSDGSDYLQKLGVPSKYNNGVSDCKKFYRIFLSAKESLGDSDLTDIFDLSTVFLAIRNFATCFSLHHSIKVDFSRNSSKNLGKKYSLQINEATYELLERARLLSTRGVGEILTSSEVNQAKMVLNNIDSWMSEILDKMKTDNHE